jgi:perosamine synthetase
MTGATIVPIDCDSQTLNIDVSKIEQKINKNTKAIMVVHIFGQPVNMNEILRIAKRYNLKVIEDAAEAHGAKYKTNRIKKEQWVKCGSEGDISIFSFYANKLITTGEGGMVVTNNSDLAEKSRLIRNLGFSKERDYIHSTFGYQFRMTNMQASLGIPQINEMPKILQTKNEIYESYKTLLSDHPAISFLKQEKWAKSCHWVTPIILDANYGNAKNFRAELASVGIETRPFFTGIHQQPIYKDNNFYMEKDFKCSTYATKQGIILPSGLNTRIKQIRYVSGEILRILNKSRS